MCHHSTIEIYTIWMALKGEEEIEIDFMEIMMLGIVEMIMLIKICEDILKEST